MGRLALKSWSVFFIPASNEPGARLKRYTLKNSFFEILPEKRTLNLYVLYKTKIIILMPEEN